MLLERFQDSYHQILAHVVDLSQSRPKRASCTTSLIRSAISVTSGWLSWYPMGKAGSEVWATVARAPPSAAGRSKVGGAR